MGQYICHWKLETNWSLFSKSWLLNIYHWPRVSNFKGGDKRPVKERTKQLQRCRSRTRREWCSESKVGETAQRKRPSRDGASPDEPLTLWLACPEALVTCCWSHAGRGGDPNVGFCAYTTWSGITHGLTRLETARTFFWHFLYTLGTSQNEGIIRKLFHNIWILFWQTTFSQRW